jgi:hypothetical protein
MQGKALSIRAICASQCVGRAALIIAQNWNGIFERQSLAHRASSKQETG